MIDEKTKEKENYNEIFPEEKEGAGAVMSAILTNKNPDLNEDFYKALVDAKEAVDRLFAIYQTMQKKD